MKLETGAKPYANQIIDALVKTKLDLYQRNGKEPTLMVTLSHYGWKALMHTCELWFLRQGSLDPQKHELMGCPYRIEPDQSDPFHIWVQSE